jgi:transposase InsO family protein
MPFLEQSVMSQKEEFVLLALKEGANRRALCRRYGISAQLGYKLITRYKAEGPKGLEARSRRPRQSPKQTPASVEQEVVALRHKHPCWGGRKIAARLKALDTEDVPSPSTVTGILRRHALLGPGCASGQKAFIRFEHAEPNHLWQMDFKGHFALGSVRCHPLTVLDDHSRFNLCLAACPNEQTETVQDRLTATFRRYGLPERMTMDNGSPWGNGPGQPYTQLGVWLMRLGIRVGHSTPYHPQTQGKDERFHRTLKAELLAGRTFADMPQCQQAFDRWRDCYNCERPHEALELNPPIARYRSSPRPFPETLPDLAYTAADHVRKVQDQGFVSFLGHQVKLPKAFVGQSVAFRPTLTDGVWLACFASHTITEIDLRSASC